VFQQTTPHGHIIAVAFFMTFAYAGWSAPGAAQHDRTEVAVEGPFKSKKVGTSATDLSGIACQPPVGGQHTDVRGFRWLFQAISLSGKHARCCRESKPRTPTPKRKVLRCSLPRTARLGSYSFSKIR
jgi:hypothetical protein